MDVSSAVQAATAVTTSDFQSVIDALTAQVSVSTVVTVIAGGMAACVGLAFMWWGVRKLIRMIMAAFKKGKVSA